MGFIASLAALKPHDGLTEKQRSAKELLVEKQRAATKAHMVRQAVQQDRPVKKVKSADANFSESIKPKPVTKAAALARQKAAQAIQAALTQDKSPDVFEVRQELLKDMVQKAECTLVFGEYSIFGEAICDTGESLDKRLKNLTDLLVSCGFRDAKVERCPAARPEPTRKIIRKSVTA